MDVARTGTLLLACALGMLVTCTPAAGDDLEGRAGFYLVLAEDPAAEALPKPTSAQRIARFDRRFLQREDTKAPIKYLLLQKEPDVALLLSRPPEKQKGDEGRTELLFEATEKAAADLARLTRDHLGQQLAFIVGEDVVSTHTIRSVITDGKFRLSRCTDNACEYIYGRLTKP